MSKIHPIDWKRADILIDLALEEDLGENGDITTNSVIPAGLRAKAVLLAKQELVAAGMPIAERLFKKLDPATEFKPLAAEGELCAKGRIMAEISGSARVLLTGERTVLNFLQHLSGIATMSRKYQLLAGDKTEVLDTRKTIPGWRNLEKYAVSVGGAHNHRIGLFDRVMIKDNHRELAGLEGAGGITRSVNRARETFPGFEVEVEIDSLTDLQEAIEAGAEYILLDNMDNATMAEAVRINAGRAKLEASGNVTEERLPSIAETGVDQVSSGALTHSVKAADISLDIVLDPTLS